MSLHNLLEHFRQSAANPRDLGDRFERLIVAYLKTDPLHADRFSDVWLFNEWPQKGNVSDVGIDIVAREAATGDFCGIQCKFYLPEHTISKDDTDSFVSALAHQTCSRPCKPPPIRKATNHPRSIIAIA